MITQATRPQFVFAGGRPTYIYDALLRLLEITVLWLGIAAVASAANRYWIGANNNWDNAADNWSTSPTPPHTTFDEPDADDVAIFNTMNSVDLARLRGTQTVLGLRMSNEINLSTNGNDLTVNGTVELSDANTDLYVDANSTLMADWITINSGAEVTLRGGEIIIEEESGTGVLDVNNGGDLSGNGTILFNDAVSAGTQVFNLDGTLTAASTAVDDFLSLAFATLTINIADSDGVIDLDGNDGVSTINVLRNDTLVLNGGVLDSPYSGTMNLSAGATFSRNVPWSFNGSLNANTGGSTAATIAGTAEFQQSGGSINVDAGETLQISSSTFTTTNGTINNSGHIIFDSGTTEISGITFNMTGPTASLTVNEASIVNIVSNDLELDGAGTATNVVTIYGTLNLTLSGSADESFTGTINLNGGNLGVFTSDNDWSLGGTVNVGYPYVSFISGDEVTLNGQVNLGADSTLTFWPQAIYDGATISGGAGEMTQVSAVTVASDSSISLRRYSWSVSATTTINPGATLDLNVTNIGALGDQFNNVISINSGTLDVTVADGEWQLGTFGTFNFSGTINLIQTTTNIPILRGSDLRVTNGVINVDGGGTIAVPNLVLEPDEDMLGTIRFVDDGGTLFITGHLELVGQSNITDLTDDPSVDTQLELHGGLTVTGNSVVLVDTFHWDRSPTTIGPGASLSMAVDNIELTGPQQYDNALTINNGGSLYVNLVNHDSWIMNGDLRLNAGSLSGTKEVEIGNDAGTFATLNVGAPGTSYIQSPVQFNSDADVYIETGATLIVNGAAWFTPVNGPNNGRFRGGGATWLLQGPVTFAEATTIDMPEGLLGLVGSSKSVAAPVTMNVGTMLPFNGSMSISAPGRLTVNLTNPNGSWTIGNNAIIYCSGNSPSDIFLAGSDINHHGTINVYGQGQIAARLDIGSLGEINIIDADGSLTLSGGSLADPNISGGEINGPGELIIAPGTALVGDGIINADVNMGNFREGEIRADNGILELRGALIGGTIGTADDDGTLNVLNDFTIVFFTTEGTGVDLRGGQMNSGQITNNVFSGITGFGRLAASQLINNGRIRAEGGTLVLDRAGTTAGYDWDGAAGDGQLYAVDGNLTLVASGVSGFGGKIEVGHGVALADVIDFQGLAFFNDSNTEIELTGGIYRADALHLFGGKMEVYDATSELDVDDAIFQLGSQTDLLSDLRLRRNTTIADGATFTSNGGTLINLNGATLTIENGANVANLVINNQGTLNTGASPGHAILESYTQTDTGTLEIELGGTGPNDIDRLTVTGQASIAGTLNFSLINDFVPSGGETFDFLSAPGGITGAFDTINLPSLPFGLSWSFSNDDPTMFQFIVIEGLPGDHNQDGTVDSADYVLWRKNDGTQEGYNTWRANFGQTAGSGSASALPLPPSPFDNAVPEPPSLALLLFAAASLLAHPRDWVAAKNRC